MLVHKVQFFSFCKLHFRLLFKLHLSFFHRIQFYWFANYSFYSVVNFTFQSHFTNHSFSVSKNAIFLTWQNSFSCFVKYGFLVWQNTVFLALRENSFTCSANYSFCSVVNFRFQLHFTNHSFPFRKMHFFLTWQTGFSCFANYSFSLVTKHSFLFSQITVFSFCKIQFACLTNYSFFPFFKLVQQNMVLLVSLNANFRQNKSIIKDFIVQILQACLKCMGHFLSAETLEMHLQ